MKADTTFIDWFSQLLIKPKFTLCILALGNFLAIPARFGAACFYNWKYEFWFAFLLLIAASALWLEKWWSYIGAAFLSGVMVYGFVYGTLKVFDVIAKSPADAELWGTPENWLRVMANRPEEPAQIILAALIFCFASFYLIRLIGGRKRLVML
jgi:hypothetical protein